MKITPLFFATLLFSVLSYSQVGIGTITPDASTLLEVSSSNKGVLLPKVALTGTTDVTTIANPAMGLLIFNTANVPGLNVGYTYWNGSRWSTFLDISTESSDWSLSGNELTGNEFLGTTNEQSLQLRVNNNQIGLFAPNGGIAIGLNTQAKDNNSIAIGTNAKAITSNQALAIGYGADASAFQSTSIGLGSKASQDRSLALGNNSAASGQNSTALGVSATASAQNAMAMGNASNAGASKAIAIGNEAQALDGSGVAIGASSFARKQSTVALGAGADAKRDNSLAIGNGSIADGFEAAAFGSGAQANSTGSTAIGRGAIANGVDAIVLGNADAYVGIGTSSPDNATKLHVAGKVKIVDGTQGTGKVLTSDANGRASWQPAVAPGTPQIVAAGVVNAAGIALKINGATVSKINVGDYQVTFTTARPSANYVINIATLDCGGNCQNGTTYDDPGITYYNRTATGFRINIGDNDNGVSARLDTDLEFSFSVIDF
ncbi:hypothetical protein [Nonlabens agnitus]|uniref:Trimeric autotransporter adhesin YadA-like head domain-containing protein n=1 Tax=Nonlabens agnitus TaxID=870484 RepID=A0A2S9WS95_9FLAO|nr:hypothetical protein [Nonlabens agnitus]PRP66355.1 hypothetical protein BST86_04250 [Nonlabens agnitus]